ncbi:MAG: cation:proton antiporter, partial [Candidatus Promineifilaceae bacterium]
MHLLLVFSITLLTAVLVSGYARRSILSTAILFLIAGFAVGGHTLGIVFIEPTDEIVAILAVLALLSILFTDGMRVGLAELRQAWRLPGRALLLGMPLAFLLTAGLARWAVGLSWTDCFLLGAVLAPTDPVFAAALVGREEVPKPLRRLLNVESGLNDGLALPVVVLLLAAASNKEVEVLSTLGEVALGILVGIVLPWIAVKLEASKYFGAALEYRPLNAFAIGLLILSVCYTIDGNAFLAAFAAGVTIATFGPEIQESFHEF